jgi:hypothetical protein
VSFFGSPTRLADGLEAKKSSAKLTKNNKLIRYAPVLHGRKTNWFSRVVFPKTTSAILNFVEV